MKMFLWDKPQQHIPTITMYIDYDVLPFVGQHYIVHCSSPTQNCQLNQPGIAQM